MAETNCRLCTNYLSVYHYRWCCALISESCPNCKRNTRVSSTHHDVSEDQHLSIHQNSSITERRELASDCIAPIVTNYPSLGSETRSKSKPLATLARRRCDYSWVSNQADHIKLCRIWEEYTESKIHTDRSKNSLNIASHPRYLSHFHRLCSELTEKWERSFGQRPILLSTTPRTSIQSDDLLSLGTMKVPQTDTDKHSTEKFTLRGRKTKQKEELCRSIAIS